MFENTVQLVASADDAFQTFIISSGDRKTVRSSAGTPNRTLTIQHSLSNENPGFETTRSNVRVSEDKILTGSDKVVTGYVQVTTSFPKEQWTEAEASRLAAEIINFLKYGINMSNTAAVNFGELAAGFGRLYAGEP